MYAFVAPTAFAPRVPLAPPEGNSLWHPRAQFPRARGCLLLLLLLGVLAGLALSPLFSRAGSAS
ncbi:MAG TPA: hypothetical protein VNF07_07075, partial [Acidimicrobiales bacterium]|nr:hypothetical protein [Acidimicrobiales bacterium]